MGFGLDELTWQGRAALASTKGCRARSVWGGGNDIGPVSDRFSAAVPGGDVVFVILGGCT